MKRTRQQRQKARKKGRNRKLNSWSEQDMASAIDEYMKRKREVGNSSVGLRQIARMYGVPKSTFER